MRRNALPSLLLFGVLLAMTFSGVKEVAYRYVIAGWLLFLMISGRYKDYRQENYCFSVRLAFNLTANLILLVLFFADSVPLAGKFLLLALLILCLLCGWYGENIGWSSRIADRKKEDV